MKGFLKFLALVVVGFSLGAGVAWFQHPHSLNSAVSTEENPQDYSQESISKRMLASTAEKIAEKEAKARLKKAAAAAPNAASDIAVATTPAPPVTTVPDVPAASPNIPVAAATGTGTGTEALTLSQSIAEASGDGATAVTGATPEKSGPKPADPTIPAAVGGAFSLTDHNGNEVTEKSWPGKYLLVFFGFTHCPDICPITLDKLTSVLDALGSDAAKVQTLYITVDPSRDTVDVMKEYVGHFHKSMLGLTGSAEQVKAAEDAYKVYASRRTLPNGSDYSFDHSAFAYFMSPDGKLAEIIKVEDKPTEITDRIKPYLDGTKKPDAP